MIDTVGPKILTDGQNRVYFNFIKVIAAIGH